MMCSNKPDPFSSPDFRPGYPRGISMSMDDIYLFYEGNPHPVIQQVRIRNKHHLEHLICGFLTITDDNAKTPDKIMIYNDGEWYVAITTDEDEDDEVKVTGTVKGCYGECLRECQYVEELLEILSKFEVGAELEITVKKVEESS